MNARRWIVHTIVTLVGALLLPAEAASETVTLQVRDTELSEVVEMIARQQRVNVLMSGEVSGTVSISLYEAPLHKALKAVANAAGYALEKNGSNYFIVPHEQVGNYQHGNVTAVRVYEVDYVDGQTLQQSVEDQLSVYGSASFIPERNVLVVRDKHEFLYGIDRLMKKIDRQPRQVMIEAKILEVTLNEDEKLGIDWTNLFNSNGGSGSFGVRGNTDAGQGFFFDLVTPDVEVALSAMQDEGRLHTLSTPKLVALEDKEASVVIGDRRGYQVTTTINQVTTESIEFLESGVILRVVVSIDESGKVMMQIHPEVSTGNVDANGIPSQTTTEVTTNVIVPSGETVFIGGLIKATESRRRTSVPGVNRVPLVRRLFAGRETSQLTTETIVLIRPVLADDLQGKWNTQPIEDAGAVDISEPVLEPWVWPGTGGLAREARPDVEPGELEEDVPTAAVAESAVALRSPVSDTSCRDELVKVCYPSGCRCEAL